MKRALRQQIKSIGAKSLASHFPQCSYDRLLLILGHMRCGSTALSNVLCEHPHISGFGEADVVYSRDAALGELVLKQIHRRCWKPTAPFLFDKVLHTSCDGDPQHDFYRSRAIFLIREPEKAIPSIMTLATAVGDFRFAQEHEAASYYGDRLEYLGVMWKRFAPDRRIALQYGSLVEHTDAALGRIARMLGLVSPLANLYRPRARSWRNGAGDALSAPRFNHIVPSSKATTIDADKAALRISPVLLSRAQETYAACTATLELKV